MSGPVIDLAGRLRDALLAATCPWCRTCGSCDAGLAMSCTCGDCTCVHQCGHPRCGQPYADPDCQECGFRLPGHDRECSSYPEGSRP